MMKFDNKDSVTLPREGTSPGGSFVKKLVNCFFSILAFSSSLNFKFDLSMFSSRSGAMPDFVHRHSIIKIILSRTVFSCGHDDKSHKMEEPNGI